jgi:hypothetical protein
MTEAPAKAAPKKENFIVNIAFNLLIPGLILSDWGKQGLAFLMKSAGQAVTEPNHLGEARLVIAVAFPAAYFVFDYIRRRQANVISMFGFVGTLLSGAVGLMKLDPFWFAVKEAMFPGVIGAGMYLSQWAGKPLVKAFVWNETVMHTDKITAAVSERGRDKDIEKLFGWCTQKLAPVFLLSAVAHFVLARWLVTAHPVESQDTFNAQLSKFNFIAWPLVLLPSMAFMVWLMLKFMKRLGEVSGLAEEELYRG